MDAKFIERRKEPRLPYGEKVIFTDGVRSFPGHAVNISRGGIFMTSLNPAPIETIGTLAFLLPNHPTSLCLRVKIAHIVFDRQRCEVDCGMGFQFLDVSKSHKSILNLHILNEQSAYLELREILKEERPDFKMIARVIKRLPHLANIDLLALRYRVNRICTIFDAAAGQSLSA